MSTVFQRKGIGKKRIASLITLAKTLGCNEVFVAAEKAEEYALEFYRSTGTSELDSVHFFYSL